MTRALLSIGTVAKSKLSRVALPHLKCCREGACCLI
jgi:hypothetical protein